MTDPRLITDEELSDAYERFWSKVEKTDTCWLWTGATDQTGYGVLITARERGWNATPRRIEGES